MTLLNPALLFGMVLAAAPVILHLLLKRKPKRLVFPALRLVQQRRKQNLKRIQLRHIWLMLLRVLAIALIVLALTRPSLPAANYSFNLREWCTLLAVIAAGVAIYHQVVSKWRRAGLPRHVFQLKASTARGWATGGTLLALLLLLGWPYQRRIAAEIKAPPPAAELDLPAAAVFLFDVSLSMNYQQAGKTRLDVAREVAEKHLSELPSGSRVAVVDAANDNPVLFHPTLSAAQTRLKALTTQAATLPFNERVRSCLLAQEEDRQRTLQEQGQGADEVRKDRFLRRVYIFTDLAKSAWRLGGSSLLQKEAERLKGINIFLVDVGELLPKNLAILELRLSRQQAPVGGRLDVSALVQGVGEVAPEAALEMSRLLPEGGVLQSGRAQQSLVSGEPQWVTLPALAELRGPVLHGEVRLGSSDPLAMDDVRTFSVRVGDPPRVLVSAPSEAEAFYWRTALSPAGVKFQVDFLPASKLAAAEYSRYDVVYLINIPQLSDAEWRRLGEFVEGGGGVGLFTGSQGVKPSGYARAPAQTFLPAQLEAVRERRDRHLVIDAEEHPVFRSLSEDGTTAVMESDVFIDRFFKLKTAEGAVVLAHATDEDSSPLIVERTHGKGRTVLFASSVDPAHGGLSRWNNFSDFTQNAWPFLAFSESLTLYLARSSDNVFNVIAGEDVVLHEKPMDADRTYLLKRPQFKQTRVSLPAGQESLLITDAHEIGVYDLVDASATTEPLLGFSVNGDPKESDLSRLTESDLDKLLGEDRYQTVRSIEELEASVITADLGREVFPLVLVLVIVAFLGEHLVANRFYDVEEGDAAVTPGRRPGARVAGPPGGTPPPSSVRGASGPGGAVRAPS